MPALNIMAIQETVRNSGSSSSPPSGIRPYLLAASHDTKITKNDVVRTKNQPEFVMTQDCAELDADARPGVLTIPHTTNPTDTIPVIQKTTGAILLRHVVVCMSTP